MRQLNNLESAKVLPRLLKKIDQDALRVGLSKVDIQRLKDDCIKVFSRNKLFLP